MQVYLEPKLLVALHFLLTDAPDESSIHIFCKYSYKKNYGNTTTVWCYTKLQTTEGPSPCHLSLLYPPDTTLISKP